jgi:thimet oligopeptidase
MMKKQLMLVLGACLLAHSALAAEPETAAAKPSDPLRAWVGLKDPASMESWVNWQISEEKRLIAQLLAVKGPRTVDNTLAPYDEAQTHLTLAGNQAYLMFAVHAQKTVREKAQALLQVISTEGTILSLNQDVYKALSAVDVSKGDAATKHYKDWILLEYKLGGVDKDDATRAKVRKLQDQATDISLKFSRIVNDDVRKIPVKDASELDGLPADYIARHKPAADGTVTLTTDQPDVTPVLTYAKSA